MEKVEEIKCIKTMKRGKQVAQKKREVINR